MRSTRDRWHRHVDQPDRELAALQRRRLYMWNAAITQERNDPLAASHSRLSLLPLRLEHTTDTHARRFARWRPRPEESSILLRSRLWVTQ